jgi:hypothetical protein
VGGDDLPAALFISEFLNETTDDIRDDVGAFAFRIVVKLHSKCNRNSTRVELCKNFAQVFACYVT